MQIFIRLYEIFKDADIECKNTSNIQSAILPAQPLVVESEFSVIEQTEDFVRSLIINFLNRSQVYRTRASCFLLSQVFQPFYYWHGRKVFLHKKTAMVTHRGHVLESMARFSFFVPTKYFHESYLVVNQIWSVLGHRPNKFRRPTLVTLQPKCFKEILESFHILAHVYRLVNPFAVTTSRRGIKVSVRVAVHSGEHRLCHLVFLGLLAESTLGTVGDIKRMVPARGKSHFHIHVPRK